MESGILHLRKIALHLIFHNVNLELAAQLLPGIVCAHFQNAFRPSAQKRHPQQDPHPEYKILHPLRSEQLIQHIFRRNDSCERYGNPDNLHRKPTQKIRLLIPKTVSDKKTDPPKHALASPIKVPSLHSNVPLIWKKFQPLTRLKFLPGTSFVST